MAVTELKVTQDLEKPFTIAIFPYTDSWCLVPFSSNVSWDPKHKGIDCFAVAIKSIAYIQGKGGQERDTQQEIFNTKLAADKYNSCNSDA